MAEQLDDVRSTPVPLGTARWFGLLAAILTQEVDRQPEVMRGAEFCFQEVLTGVPPDGGTIAWHVRFCGGRIAALGYGSPIGDPDVQQTIDWADALPLAMAKRSDPMFGELAELLVERGGIAIRGDLSVKLARSPMFDRVHDRLAPLTNGDAANQIAWD